MATLTTKSLGRPLTAFWKDTVDAGKSAVALYFRPLFWVTKSEVLTSRALGFPVRTEIDNRNVELLALIKAAVCFNQGSLIEYSFLLAEKHKEMKTAYLSNAESQTLKSLTNDLLNYLNRSFFEITFKNFDFLHSYFAARSAAIPRVCIKGNFAVDDSQNVISIFRDQPVKYKSDVKIEENSGFYSIKQNGRYFIENDIPEAVLKRNYVNPRLDVAKIKADAKSGKRLSEISTDWDKYWKDYEPGKEGDSSFYKSTLIVPLTLWNNDLSPEFKKLSRIENIERVIFGFLCFDHREAGFFDPEADVHVGYIFADLLSVYVFDRKQYTDASNTFENVKKKLRSENAQLDIDKLNADRIRRLWKKTFKIEEVASHPKETKKNHLASADDVLLTSVRPDIKANVD